MITQEKSPAPTITTTITKEKSDASWWQKLSLRWKVTGLAIAISTIPLLVIGSTAYYFADKSITKQIIELGQIETADLQDKVYRFMKERYGDIQVMANLDIFTNPAATAEQKAAALEHMKAAFGVYDSIAIFDLQGEPIAQTKEGKKLGNHLNRTYIQEALQVNGAVLSQPAISTTKGSFSIYAASTIKDKNTGKSIGFIRARIPVKVLEETIQNYKTGGKQYYLLNEAGEVFLGPEGEYVNKISSSGKNVANDSQYESVGLDVIFSGVKSILTAEEVSSTLATSIKSNTKYLMSLAPPIQIEGLPALNWQAVLAMDTDVAFAPQKQLRLTLILGTGIVILLVTVMATIMANRGTRPILTSTETVKKLGQGDLEQRMEVRGVDELAQLGSNINLMAAQIQALLKEREAEALKQSQQKEQLEAAIYTLIDEVSHATDGDLTVRANLDSLELSTVADLFNAIIDNLQEIAIEVKQSTSQVGSSLKQNEEAIRLLAEQAITQAKETRDTLMSVEQMSQSIQVVAENASQAEKIADDTYKTIVNSTNNMDLTVDSILNLRTTVGETAKKMKRLGESSQKISQVVSFIEEIALKTNVLAINASVEAGRAGEYGQGFTIVAEQVGALAEQSAAATKEIASIVAAIQAETQEVNQAMESGTTQVVDTTRLVESTKQSLSLILEKSQEINHLMGSISQTTVSQANTSQNVNNLMQKIAQLSETTSISSKEVAQSIVETAQVAEKLDSTVAKFKVAESS